MTLWASGASSLVGRMKVLSLSRLRETARTQVVSLISSEKPAPPPEVAFDALVVSRFICLKGLRSAALRTLDRETIL